MLKAKHILTIELVTVLSLNLVLLWLSFGQASLLQPWPAVWLTVLVTWLLPGFLLWRMFGDRQPQPWFYWLPISFGLGLAWLLLPAGLILIFKSNLTSLVWLVAGLNSLLLLAYTTLRLAKKLDWPTVPANKESADRQPLNGWLLGCALAVMVALLLVFFNSIGFTWSGDEWTYMLSIRYFLDVNIISVSFGFDIWDLIIALMTHLSGVALLDVYRIYLPALFMIVAALAYLLLADTLFKNQNIAYFAFAIQGLYLLSDIHTDSNGIGLGFLARLLEDKYTAWLLILPLVQTFFLMFIRSGHYHFLFWFGVMAAMAIAIHPIAITWVALSMGSASLLFALFRRERRLIIFYSLFFILVSLGAAFGWWLRFEKLMLRPDTFASSTAWDYLITLSARRVFFFSIEQDSYMAHPFLLSHPLVILALLLSLWLLFELKHSLVAQFLFSNTIVVLLLLFNPITAPLLGRFTGFWQIYRIAWMLPVSLTVGYVLYELLQRLGQFLQRRRPFFTRNTVWLKLLPLLSLLLIAGLLRSHIITSWRSLRAWNGTTVTAAERDLMAYVRQQRYPGSMVLAPHQLNIHLRAIVGQIRTFTNRETSRRYPDRLSRNNKFYQAQRVDQFIIETLQEGKPDYIIVERDMPLDAQLRFMPNHFKLLYANPDYALYAWRSNPMTGAEQDVIVGNTHRLWGDLSAAEIAYQQALQKEPHYMLALMGLGAVYEAQLDIEKAITLYEEAVQAGPDNPWFRVKLAETYASVARAEDNLEMERVIGMYQQALATAPNDMAIYNEVVAAYSKLPNFVRQMPAGQILEQTIIAFFQTRADAEPHYYPSQLKLARVYELLRDETLAITQYSLMARRFPGNVEPYLQQAGFYAAHGNTELALQAYQQAIEEQAQPKTAYPYVRLAAFYRQQENYEQALIYAQKAATVANDNKNEYWPVEVHLEQGQIYQAQQKKEQAISHYRRVTELSPERGLPHILLADMLFEMGHASEGLQELQQAILAEPESNFIQQRIEALILKYQLLEAALPYLEEAAGLNPENIRLHFWLEETLTRLNHMP